MKCLAIIIGIVLGLFTSDVTAKVLFVPEAICSTIVTNMPLPTYVCCQLYDSKHQQYVFEKQWVAGSCKNVDANATFSMGCNPDSLVYGTNHPIPPIARFCQFSYSAIKDYEERL